MFVYVMSVIGLMLTIVAIVMLFGYKDWKTHAKGIMRAVRLSLSNENARMSFIIWNIISFILLALTGFFASIYDGMSGMVLQVHLSVGTIFTITSVGMFIYYAKDHIFVEGEFGTIRTDKRALRKLIFWVLQWSGIMLILSVFFSLTKIFGTDMQIILVEIHRFYALVYSASFVYFNHLLTSGE